MTVAIHSVVSIIALRWPVLPIFGESFRFCFNRVIEPNTGINTGILVLLS